MKIMNVLSLFDGMSCIQYDAICEGKYFFRGLYEFESINGQEITLKEMV